MMLHDQRDQPLVLPCLVRTRAHWFSAGNSSPEVSVLLSITKNDRSHAHPCVRFLRGSGRIWTVYFNVDYAHDIEIL